MSEIAETSCVAPPVPVAEPAEDHPNELSGILFAGSAYAFWGVMPLYWRLLSNVPPFELTIHRIFWCAWAVALATLARGRAGIVLAVFKNPPLLATLALTGTLISINWTIFIYCVATHQLVEASLGYYMTPFLSFGLGVVFLRERMSPVRIAAVAFAATALIVRGAALGHISWIGPSLALSFGLYGFFRKRAPVDALDGLAVETWLLFPFTAALIGGWWITGKGSFPSSRISTDTLLILGGALTAAPLAMFAAGARRMRLTTLGFLQYVTPSATLLLATIFLGEPFTRLDVLSFGCVGAAIALVLLESRFTRRFSPRAP